MKGKKVNGSKYKKKMDYSARQTKPSNYATGMERGGKYK